MRYQSTNNYTYHLHVLYRRVLFNRTSNYTEYYQILLNQYQIRKRRKKRINNNFNCHFDSQKLLIKLIKTISLLFEFLILAICII